MKNFTPFGRLLLLAVFLLSAFGLSAQQSCNLDPSLIEISVKNTCTDGGATEQPYVTIDFGSTAVDGMTEITIESFFLGNINLGTYTITVPVVFGFSTFELPGFALPTPNNFVRLNEVEDLETGCVQTFGAGDVESGFYSTTTSAAIAIAKDNTRSIDPPCGGIPTGRLSVRVSPTDGMFPNNRFSTSPQDVRLVPSTFATFISVIPPGTTPNPPNSGYYIVETNQSLVSGDYTLLLFDNVTGCEVSFETEVGDPANNFDVDGQPAPVSCFGVSDGSIKIVPLNADPAINGFLNYTLSGSNGLQRTGTIAASNGIYNMPTEMNLPAGDYNLFLTASNGGCTGEDMVTIETPDEIVVTGIDAPAICADETFFELNIASITGISANSRYRLIDGSLLDMDPGNNNGCWNRPGSGRDPLSTGLNQDGSYTFTLGVADPNLGCYDIRQDTTVAIFLEIQNAATTCLDTFPFTLQINAQPETPVVSLSAVNLTGIGTGDPYCSNQEVTVEIADFDPAFTYDIAYTPITGVVGSGAFTNSMTTYTGAGTVVGSFSNSTNSLQTVNFTVTSQDNATGCVSEVETFSFRVRPLPVVDPIVPGSAVVCSQEFYTSPAITLNGNGGNGNVRFNYAWSFGPELTFLSGLGTSVAAGGLASGDQVNGRFQNTSGVAQTATLTITPTFPQNGNDCEGASETITVTVSPRPSLNYDLTIGDLDTMLETPNIASFEICNGEDFLLDNLDIPEDHAGNNVKFVRYRVRGDARFLQINTNGSNFGPTDVQTTQFIPIDNFTIGQPNIQNNHPANNAQVAEIILTPYFQDPGAAANAAAFQMCPGQPVRLFLTVNPTPPVLSSPQTTTVCSDERIEYPIMGASGVGNNLETRITEANVFAGQTDATFTVPAGASRIEDFRFELSGGNGGSTTTTGGTGGLGAIVTGSLDDTELLPGDVVTIRKGLAGGGNNTSGDGGDATTLTVTRAGSVIYTYVAAGGGGAGSAMNGRNGRAFTTDPAADGAQGQGPGGFGGTGFSSSPVAEGGNGNINGGGGGGGWVGGDGGNSQTGQSGQGGASFASTSTAPASFAPKADTDLADGEARIFYTVVFDDIRFTEVSTTFDSDSLTDVGEALVDGEVDTILFGQQFINITDNPQDVTYVFSTSTEASCDDGGTVEIVVTIAPEPTAFLADAGTDVTVDADGNYTATVCSGEAIDALIGTMITPPVDYNTAYVDVSEQFSTNVDFGTFGSSTTNGRINLAVGSPVAFNQAGVFNNTGVDQTITYTIEPHIARPGQANCAGEPFTFTVTVQPGFSVDMNQPVVDVCSRVTLSAAGFDLDASQPGINVNFDLIRVVDLRITAATTEFSISGLDTTGLAAGGFMLNRTDNFFNDAAFTNREGNAVGVQIDVVFISDDGCESQTVTYPFNVRAEPIIDESNTAITICEGEATGLTVLADANSAFFNNFSPNQVTFSYTLDAGNLTYTGSNVYPLTGGTTIFQGDTFDNPTSMPQTATYTVVATSQFSCESQLVTYEVTVLPDPELDLTASQGATTIDGQSQLANIETLTICSGTTVDFAISQDVTGTGVSYRIQRDVTGSVANGDGSAVDNFEGGLAVANFQETLVNTGTGSATVQYKLEAYTYGPNGMDDDGLTASDDCVGISQRVIIEVLPEVTDENALRNNIAINNPNVGITNPGNGAQICDNSEVIISPRTLVDPTTGAAFIWRRENDGPMLGGATAGSGTFQTGTNANNYFPALGADRIRQVITAEDAETQEVRYIVTLYSFGTDGIDDMLAAGSDDCIGDIDTVTLQLDPTPVLTADLEIGTAPVVSLDAAGSTYTYEICSGEDFLLDNLDFPEMADGKLKHVEFTAIGQIEFLGLAAGGFGAFQTVSPIGNFSLGALNVQNTEPNGLAQTAFLFLTPYFEDGVDDQTRDAAECSGETIQITVTINATPPVLGPFTETVCSEERVEFQIPGASNTGFRSRVAGSTTFDASDDFVVPPGAARIFNVDFSLSGANGGAALNNRGGLGGVVESSINPLFGGGNPTILYPGDTVRVRKGVAGAASPTNGGGGDATLLCIIAGPRDGFPAAPQGSIVETLLAGGGGGAGIAEAGADAGAEQNSPPSSGADGAGLGGFGGTGWDAANPQSGSFGGAGRGNGGGGGGGWNGGDGGSNVNGMAGGFGTSYAGTVGGGAINADFFTKDFSDPAEGTVTMEYILVFDDVRFDVVSRTIDAGLIDVSDNPIVSGEIDTILFGERFDNPTDAPLDVVYVFSTSSEANCPGGQVEVTLTVEPTPTLDLAGNGTMITDNGDGTYAAEICSGDSLSAILSSMTIPSQGTTVLRARVLDVALSNTATVSFGTGDGGEASASTNLNGNNQPSTNDVPFYEASIINNGTVAETVTYTVVPFIINTVGSSGVECRGDTLTLTVTVNPEFTGVVAGPIQTNVCSNVSLEDSGFDLSASQSVQITFDSIMIDTVTTTAGGDMNFDTISSVYNGTPVTVRRSEDFFNDDTYRNRTGGPVFVTYTVRLVSGPGCTSDPIEYVFRYTAEPVIDIVESATNQIDTTICSGDMTGLIVTPAANSAFSTIADFNNNIDLEFSINLPTGVTLTKTNGIYPDTRGRAYFRDDILENNTAGPLDVVYTVKPTNNGCAGDSVNYTVTVNPNPFADVILVSQDSSETFGLANSRLSVTPNPQFGVCSGQAVTALVPSVSAVAEGTLMVNFEISVDADGASGYPVGTTYTFPAGELADSLSYDVGELVNTTNANQFFTVEYRAYIEANGTPGFQNDGVDCLSDGIIQFDVVVNPVNGAFATTEMDGTSAAFPAGTDTICSGEVFDFLVRNTMSTGIPVDSFVVDVTDTGLDAVGSTPTGTFVIQGALTPTNGVRSQDFAYTNTTPGIKTVTYIVTPFSGDCAGTPDTTTVSYRAEIMLEANEPVLCADPGVSTSLFAIDANGGMISADRMEYRYEYIGGTASGYALERGTGGGFTFVGDPVNQANTIVYNNQRSLVITPSATPGSFTPGTVNFEVIYDDVANGCGVVTDTITLNFQTTAEAGMADQGLGILCDEVNFVLNDALIDEDEGGVFTFTNGDPGLGILNGANFTPMVGGADPAPVSIGFTYTVGGGNSGCAIASVDFTIAVEPAPNAGTYDGTVGEACEAATPFNIFDLLDGEMQNGTFTQTAGADFVTVNPDGTINQDNITPGLYEFSYEVMSASGCGSDMVTGVMVQVNSREDCSTFVGCDVIELTAGFNVISFDVIPNDNSIESIFADEIANNDLLTVVALYADIGQPQSYTFVPGFGGINSIQGGLRPGYGYIVEVANDATIEVCGPAVDPDLRVELLAGLNIVGYAGAAPESVFTYFDELINNNDLVLARTRTNGQPLETIFQPFIFGNLFSVENSVGYIIDVNTAYGNGTWRDNGPLATSTFDRLYGMIENGDEFVGETLTFTDADGMIVGQTEVLEGGVYMNTFLFGDLETTERLREGLSAGETFFANLRGEQIATELDFNGDWRLTRLDLNFSGLSTGTEDVEQSSVFSMSMFPNPTQGLAKLEVNLPTEYKYLRVEIFSLLGQVVSEQTIDEPGTGLHQVDLDLSDLPAGTYQIRVTSDADLLANRQLVKQ